MSVEQVRNVCGAALLAAGRNLTASELVELFEPPDRPTTDEVREALGMLSQDYAGRGIELAETIFHADSEAVLAMVDLLAGDQGADPLEFLGNIYADLRDCRARFSGPDLVDTLVDHAPQRAADLCRFGAKAG